MPTASEKTDLEKKIEWLTKQCESLRENLIQVASAFERRMRLESMHLVVQESLGKKPEDMHEREKEAYELLKSVTDRALAVDGRLLSSDLAGLPGYLSLRLARELGLQGWSFSPDYQQVVTMDGDRLEVVQSGEWFQTPDETIVKHSGDCDDYAILLLSALARMFSGLGLEGRLEEWFILVLRRGGPLHACLCGPWDHQKWLVLSFDTLANKNVLLVDPAHNTEGILPLDRAREYEDLTNAIEQVEMDGPSRWCNALALARVSTVCSVVYSQKTRVRQLLVSAQAHER